MDNSSFEDSRVNLNRNPEETTRNKKSLNYFNIQDIDEDDGDSSPSKFVHKQNQLNQSDMMTSPERSHNKMNRKKSAKPTKLQPLKAAEAKKIQLDQIHKKQRQRQQKEEQSQNDKSEQQEQVQIQISRRKMKKRSQQVRKVVVFDEEDDAVSENSGDNQRKLDNKRIQNPSQNNEDPQIENEQNERQPSPNQIVSDDEPTGVHDLNKDIRAMIEPGQQMCFLIKRDQEWLAKLRPQFSIRHAANNQYFFSAKMTSSNTSSTFIASSDKNNFTENGPSYIGKMKGNFTGSEYNIYGPGYNPSDAKEKKLPLRTLLATVEYETNYFGSARPRNIRVFMLKPGVSYYDDLIGVKRYSDEVPLSELYEKPANKDKILVFTNRKPQWNQEIQGYMLNFGGKVKKASVKNFILDDEKNPQNARMVFGKVEQDEFRMDVGHPLSPFLAVGISLSAFGSKIGCE